MNVLRTWEKEEKGTARSLKYELLVFDLNDEKARQAAKRIGVAFYLKQGFKALCGYQLKYDYMLDVLRNSADMQKKGYVGRPHLFYVNVTRFDTTRGRTRAVTAGCGGFALSQPWTVPNTNLKTYHIHLVCRNLYRMIGHIESKARRDGFPMLSLHALTPDLVHLYRTRYGFRSVINPCSEKELVCYRERSSNACFTEDRICRHKELKNHWKKLNVNSEEDLNGYFMAKCLETTELSRATNLKYTEAAEYWTRKYNASRKQPQKRDRSVFETIASRYNLRRRRRT